MSNDYDNDDDQCGPAVWADQPQIVVPPMRTFKVVLSNQFGTLFKDNTVYLDAHSVTCLDDAAHFYVYRPTVTPEGTVLAAYAVRTLRPYLDVEDISQTLAATSGTMN